jgi:hypothetical protein
MENSELRGKDSSDLNKAHQRSIRESSKHQQDSQINGEKIECLT